MKKLQKNILLFVIIMIAFLINNAMANDPCYKNTKGQKIFKTTTDDSGSGCYLKANYNTLMTSLKSDEQLMSDLKTLSIDNNLENMVFDSLKSVTNNSCVNGILNKGKDINNKNYSDCIDKQNIKQILKRKIEEIKKEQKYKEENEKAIQELKIKREKYKNKYKTEGCDELATKLSENIKDTNNVKTLGDMMERDAQIEKLQKMFDKKQQAGECWFYSNYIILQQTEDGTLVENMKEVPDGLLFTQWVKTNDISFISKDKKTTNIVDGEQIDGDFIYDGIYKYTTITGDTKTIYKLKRIDTLE
ncbi:MAG: hypothetical protein Ta2D_12050 [Rickettsiales bacterium]|nr:MAG: hypothetical protein Ta2D_12050 [Rickettsiales bacterium]